MLQTVLVDTDNRLGTRVDTGLCTGGSLFDTHLGQTGLNSLGHTTQLLYLLDMLPGLMHQLVCQSLYIIATCPWVDLLTDLRFVLDIDLGVTGDTG